MCQCDTSDFELGFNVTLILGIIPYISMSFDGLVTIHGFQFVE